MSPLVRRLLVPSLMTAVTLAALIALGIWQMHRLTWKRALIAEITASEQAPAIPLPAHPGPFEKVGVRGRLRSDLAALYGADVRDIPSGRVLGGQLIVPLERAGAPPLLVDLGWVPAPDDRVPAVALPAGETEIAGYVRPPDHPGWFSAADDPKARLFYTLDPHAIGAAIGLPGVAPFTLVALGTTPPRGWPQPAQHLPHPPDNHLQYAITWFGLALVLVFEFGFYLPRVIRR